MSSLPRIRPGTQADVPQLAHLVDQYWRFESIAGFDRERVSRLLERILAQRHLGLIWVAESDEQLVGYLVAVFMLSLEQMGLMAEIDEFFVLPPARASGIGAALLLAVERDLASNGCVCLQLQLGKSNSRARTFYRRHGYAERDGYELLEKRL